MSGDVLLTRDELLGCLETRLGIRIDSGTLRYWELIGGLPKPPRRWHEGATRTRYPASAVADIARFVLDDPARAAKYAGVRPPTLAEVIAENERLKQRIKELETHQ